MAEVETLAPSEGVPVAAAPPTATETEEQKTPPVEGQPVTETPSDSAIATPEVEEEVDLDPIPENSGDFEKFKPLFKDHPELRKIVGREQAFSDIAPNGSLQELKGIVERVPSLDDAEKLAYDAQNLRALSETFRNDPAGFTESLKESDPYAFQQLATKLPQILAETDPQLYREQSVFYTNGTLDNLFARAQASGNQDAIVSIQNVAALLGMQLGMQRQPLSNDNSEAAKLRKQLADRDASDNEAKASNFWNSATEDHYTQSVSEIESLIKKSFPDVNEAQLKRMGSEVWEKVNSRLAAQPQTLAQLERFKADVSKGRMGVSDYKAIMDFSMRRTRQLMPAVWKEVSSEWSKQILTANQNEIKKRQDIAARTRSAPAPAVTAAAPPPKDRPADKSETVWQRLRGEAKQALGR